MSDVRHTLTLKEAAEQLGVHYMTAYRYVRSGRLPARRGERGWEIDPADLARLGSAPTNGRSVRPRPERLAMRLIAGDEAGAWQVIEDALTSGMSAPSVHTELVLGAMREIGDRWEAGTLDVYGEHRASAIAWRLIGRLGHRFQIPGPRSGAVVLGCPPGELHSLPVAVASDLLRWRGVEAVDLGANLPVDSFVRAALETPKLIGVGVCATSRGSRVAAMSVVQALRAEGISMVVVGGADVADATDAAVAGSSAYTRDVVSFVDTMLGRR